MKKRISFPTLLFALTAFLASCAGGSGQPLPTSAAVAAIPSPAPPTATILPPTLDLSATSAAAQTTPIPTASTRSAITPTAVDAVINITVPDAEAVVMMGDELRVFGLVQKNEAEMVWVALKSSSGRLLVEQQAIFNEIGWETTLPVPNQVSGAAVLQASIRNEAGSLQNVYEQPVWLAPNRTSENRYLLLSRPDVGETAVSGFNVFFDGELKGAVGNQVMISLWIDDCQTQVARQSFALGASTQSFLWQGFVIAPRDVDGPACAVASFGQRGSAEWREAVVPIQILAADNRDAKGIRISNPRPNMEIEAGTEMFINGSALNVSADEILVSILLENGRIVSQTPVTTDYWGYFELSVLIPVDIEGPAQIIAEFGEGDSFADGIGDIMIVPPPTPTPGP